MKKKYFNMLTIGLFLMGSILIISAISPYGNLPRNIADFINNLLASFGVSIIILAITISFIQYYLDKQQLIIIEKYEKEKEREYILNNHKILSILIYKYKILFANLIRDNTSSLNYNKSFIFKDLQYIYDLNGFVTTNLYSSKIEIFYKGEEILTKYLSRMLEGNEFKYNSNLNSILIELLTISLDHNDIKDGILWNKIQKDSIKSLLISDIDYVSKYKNRELQGNLAIPFVELYLFLNKQRELINSYLSEIEKIKLKEKS